MIKEAIGMGKTVDIAIEHGCEQIGLPREEVNIEVISLPRKAFMGLFGGSIAKVKVTAQIDDLAKAELQKSSFQQNRQAQPKAQEKPQFQNKAAQSQPKTNPAPQSQPKPPAPQRQPAQAAPAPQRQAVQPAPAAKAIISDDAVVGVPVEEGSKGAAARDFLSDVIKAMGIDNCKVTATQEERIVVLKLEGEATGVIIGKRGETLDALQYLSALASNRVEGDYARVVIDSGNYRQRRQQTLEQLAAKLAASVLRSGRNATLEPMNPYERRIIHAAVSEIEGVKSISVGEDPNRSVVITTSDGVVHQSSNPSGRRPSGRFPQGGRPRNTEGAEKSDKPRYNKPRSPRPNNQEPRQNKTAQAPQSPQASQSSQATQPRPQVEKPKRIALSEAENQPLYGKIEIK